MPENGLPRTRIAGTGSCVPGRVMEDSRPGPDDVHLLISHQANIRTITATADRPGVSTDRIFVNIHKYGNTSPAPVPVAPDGAVRERRIRRDDVAAPVASGGGLTRGAPAVRW